MRPIRRALLFALLIGCARRDVSTTETHAAQIVSDGIASWRPRIEIARGEAVRGPWKQNDSDFRYVDDPAVQLAGDGDAIVAWVDQKKKDVFLGRWSREGRPRQKAPVNVSNSPDTFSWLPRIVTHGDEVHVLWQEIVFSGGSHGGEIHFATSTDGGRTFTAALNLSNSIEGDGKGRIDEKTWDNGSLDLARGPGGEIYAAWTEYEGALWLRRSDDGGASWTRAVRVAGTRGKPVRGPSIAVDGAGKVHVAWAVGESEQARIRIATSTTKGTTFEGPVLVGEGSGRCDTPSLAVDPSGTRHVVFVENGRVGYARGSEPVRWLSGGGARLPRIALDGARHVYILYEREGTPRERTQSLVLARSTNGGDTFAESPVLGIAGPSLGFNSSQQGMLLEKMTIAPSGGEIAIANGTFLENRESRIWLLRGSLR